MCVCVCVCVVVVWYASHFFLLLGFVFCFCIQKNSQRRFSRPMFISLYSNVLLSSHIPVRPRERDMAPQVAWSYGGGGKHQRTTRSPTYYFEPREVTAARILSRHQAQQ